MTSALGVLAGGLLAQYLSPRLLSYIAGTGFMLIGVWTIWQSAVSSQQSAVSSQQLILRRNGRSWPVYDWHG